MHEPLNERWQHKKGGIYRVYGVTAQLDPIPLWRVLCQGKSKLLFYCIRESDLKPLAVIDVEGLGLILLQSPMPANPSRPEDWRDVEVVEGIHYIYWDEELPQKSWARPWGEFLDGRFQQLPEAVG